MLRKKNERIDFFYKLGELRQQCWSGKGHSCTFINDKWVTFYKKITSDYPDHSQLICITFGEHILCYLYNLIDLNVAYSTQSGFNYTGAKNDWPGIISHFLVTNNYISRA